MKLQIIQDGHGNNAGVFIPINDWNSIVKIHKDLKALVNTETSPKKKLSDLAGKLSFETAEAMQKNVSFSRIEWEGRLDKEI